MKIAAVSAFALALMFGFTVLERSPDQEPDSAASSAGAQDDKRLKIVPLVVLKAGGTEHLILSTWCTVGTTRGGGLLVAEMSEGKLQAPLGKACSRDGITVTVPETDTAMEYAGRPEFVPLKNAGLEPFVVTVTASSDAKPGLMEFHLVDSTCSGMCETDLRVLVIEE